MPFVKFTEPRRSYVAKASLSRLGMISLSDGARRRFKLDDYGSCCLYYDEDTRTIGIELVKDKNCEGAMKIRLRKTTGADIAAKSFIEFFDIGVKETMTFPIDRDDTTGMLVIELNEGRKVGRKPRTDA